MTRDARRFLRQVLVLGEAAQARVEGAREVVAREGLAADVHALYASRAGFAAVERTPTAAEPADATKAPERGGEQLTSTAAREVLEGARAALRSVWRAADGDA